MGLGTYDNYLKVGVAGRRQPPLLSFDNFLPTAYIHPPSAIHFLSTRLHVWPLWTSALVIMTRHHYSSSSTSSVGRRLFARPALPSNTTGPASFLGVRGPSPVMTSLCVGVDRPLIPFSCVVMCASCEALAGLGMSIPLVVSIAIALEPTDACRRDRSPLGGFACVGEGWSAAVSK